MRTNVVQMFTRVGALTIVAALLACGTSTAPDPPPITLLVTNGTCDSGPCVPLGIHGETDVFNVPGDMTVGIGHVDSASACLTFPASKTLYVIDAGTNDTTATTWTPADTISLFAADERSVPWEGGLLQITDRFVPATSTGWEVTFSYHAGGPGEHPTAVVPAQPCSPSQ